MDDRAGGSDKSDSRFSYIFHFCYVIVYDDQYKMKMLLMNVEFVILSISEG